MLKKIVFATTLASAAIALPSIASAQFYIGGSVGGNFADFNTSDYSFQSSAIAESPKNHVLGFKLYTGFEFNKNFAVEAGYADLGHPEYRYSGAGPLASANINGQAKVSQSAIFVAAKGILPLSEQFSLFGKLGVTSNKAKVEASSNNAAFNSLAGFPASKSDTRTSALLGVGAEFSFTPNMSVLAEFEDFGRFGSSDTIGETKARLLSLGMKYKF